MLEDAGIFLQYPEQPLCTDTFRAFKQLRNRLQTPIWANGDMHFPRNLLKMGKEVALDVGVVDIVPSISILSRKRLVGIASDMGIMLSHHRAFDFGVKTAAVVHVVSSMPPINLTLDVLYIAV